jgi:hypothetical protein
MNCYHRVLLCTLVFSEPFVVYMGTACTMRVNFQWTAHICVNLTTCLSKRHSHRFSRIFFYSLQCIIDIFVIIRQNACVIRQVKREIQTSDALLCKHGSTHLYRHVHSMRLRYSIINRARVMLTLGRFPSAISRVSLKIWNSYFVCPLEIPW